MDVFESQDLCDIEGRFGLISILKVQAALNNKKIYFLKKKICSGVTDGCLGVEPSSCLTVFVGLSCFLFFKYNRNCWLNNRLPDLDYSDILLNIVTGRAAALFRCFKEVQVEKKASKVVKLRQRSFIPVLPTIHLANLYSLLNKMDELLLLSRINKNFLNSAALYFMETWLSHYGQRATSARLPAV